VGSRRDTEDGGMEVVSATNRGVEGGGGGGRDLGSVGCEAVVARASSSRSFTSPRRSSPNCGIVNALDKDVRVEWPTWLRYGNSVVGAKRDPGNSKPNRATKTRDWVIRASRRTARVSIITQQIK